MESIAKLIRENMRKLRVTRLSAAARAVRSTWVTRWHRTYLDGSSDGFGVLFTEYVRVESGSIGRDGVGITLVWHSTAP